MSDDRDNPYLRAKLGALMAAIQAESDAALRVPESITKGPRIQPSSGIAPMIDRKDAFMAVINSFYEVRGTRSAQT